MKRLQRISPAGLLLWRLCNTFNADVSRFQELPAPQADVCHSRGKSR